MQSGIGIFAPARLAIPAFLRLAGVAQAHDAEIFIRRFGDNLGGRCRSVVGVLECSLHGAAGHLRDRVLTTDGLHVTVEDLVDTGSLGALRGGNKPEDRAKEQKSPH